jgi:hypothetical protein
MKIAYAEEAIQYYCRVHFMYTTIVNRFDSLNYLRKKARELPH